MSDIEKYKKAIFQLNELIRRLLIDSDDVQIGNIGYWLECWVEIEKENKEVVNEVYRIKAERCK